jgi:hypothetical protein
LLKISPLAFAFLLSGRKTSRLHLAGDKRDGEGKRHRRLEVELRAELEDSRIKGRRDLAEVTGAEPVTDVVEFGMVPDVKALRPKFKTPIFV